MRFTYETQGTNTYLVYTITEQDKLDTLSLGMLTNNNIKGLAQTVFMQVDSSKCIKFNISAKVSVSQLFMGPVNKRRLLGVFSGIVNAMLSAEEYMIDPISLILDTEYIFADVSTCDTNMVCVPVIDAVAYQPDIKAFFHEIMFKTQFDQSENCDHVAKIINFLNSPNMFSLAEFKKVIDDLMKETGRPTVVSTRAPAPTPAPVPVQPPAQPVQSQRTPVQQHPQSRTVPPAPVGGVPPVPAGSRPPVPPAPINRPMSTSPAPAAQPASSANADKGEEISLFYLLQHYNKENAEKYKAQKAKKSSGQAPNRPITPPVPSAANPGFAIPAQAAPPIAPNQAVSTPPTPAGGRPPMPANTPPRPNIAPAPARSIAPAPAPVQPPRPVVAPPSQGNGFGGFTEGTVILNGGANLEGTVVLTNTTAAGKRQVKAYLIRQKNGEKIHINKPVFRIGKERSYVDYFIGDNTAISRSHANIVTRGNEYYISDTNSTNHTYVNGTMLQANSEMLLKSGDVIKFANEAFDFKVE